MINDNLADGRAAFRARQLKRMAVSEVAAKHFAFFNASTPMHDRMMAEAAADVWAYRTWRDELAEQTGAQYCYQDWLDIQATPMVGCDDDAARLVWDSVSRPAQAGQRRLI